MLCTQVSIGNIALCTLHFTAVVIIILGMTPQEPQPDIKDYRPKLTVKTRDALMGLASDLAFVIDQPGRYDGVPSVRDLLDSLATAYERDPAGVKLALRVLGVVAQPSPDDVRFHSDPDAE
jgi:hypothetical protein